MTWTEYELSEVDYLKSMWVALRRIEDALAVLARPEVPAPVVNVEPPDLTDIVTAVNSLKPGSDADEIARAIADVLRPTESPPGGSEALSEVARALEKLEFRLKGIGTQAYGGAAVSGEVRVSNMVAATETGLAKDATLLRRYGDHVTKADVVSTSGDNTLHTPASGKRIRLYWIGLSASQDNTAENLIQVKLTDADGAVKYRWRMGNPGAFVGGRTIEGNVNEPLILNLANAQPIDWNIDLEEVA